jgi:hypothetical protein
MKRIIITSLLALQTLVCLAQKSQQVDWHVPFVGGPDGYHTKHYFFGEKLNALLESSKGLGSDFDGQTMQIDVAEHIFTESEERYITKYSNEFAVVVFKNITAEAADVFYYGKTFKSIEEARNFQPAPEQFQTWYTEAGYAQEMEKPGIATFTREDALDFANFYVQKCKEITEKMDQNSSVFKREMESLARMMLLSAVPIAWAKSKGYNGFKSVKVIQEGLEAFKNDEEINSLIKSTK